MLGLDKLDQKLTQSFNPNLVQIVSIQRTAVSSKTLIGYAKKDH
ncbi:hypothetical protein WJM97_00065 [Okeanomitos corallinicola TIOX110]|uniref:Uncharacterized protein n=1 Tax=Okeanomitos corallinicola TIOX110 TaxID=3133117 RepID=A0ABZ2UT38_9CYAN